MKRSLAPRLTDALDHSPAVALLGPRQSGKTTLALEIARDRPADLPRSRIGTGSRQAGAARAVSVRPPRQARHPRRGASHAGTVSGTAQPHRPRTPCRAPGEAIPAARFGLARPAQAIRRNARRTHHQPGTDTLHVLEVPDRPLDTLWLRGGFPESLLARDDARSLRWRRDFIRSYLERDIPQFGPRIAAETLRRFWTMLAHHQGGLLNTAQFAGNLGVDVKTAGSYLGLLVDLLLVRRLPPWHTNLGKRLVKSPKVYIRDSGLAHALLNVADKETLLAHPVLGASWQGFAIENLIANAGDMAQAHFYRSSSGAEIDLLLAWPDGRLWAIEIKRSLTPKPERGFHAACSDLAPERRFIVYPGDERYRLAEDIEAIPLPALAQALREA
ncbi:MAG TPA: DUF4143 domain-containing protein [Rhodocyclaceae bacterium]|nr:DUF4143 domain-containing protein [Rhodocyclaceae bacterium]